MGYYADLIKSSLVDFLYPHPYDYTIEFANKHMYSGTAMPKTKICVDQSVSIKLADLSEVPNTMDPKPIYAKQGFIYEARATFCEAAKLIWARMEREKLFSGCRFGSISMWMNRQNERRRQVLKMRDNMTNPDWIAPKNHYHENLEERKTFWINNFLMQKQAIQSMLNLDKPELNLYLALKKYIKSTNKEQTSLVPNEGLEYSYLLQYESQTQIAKLQMQFIDMLTDNIYGPNRVNPKYINPAIRNRDPVWDDPKKGGITLQKYDLPAINGVPQGIRIEAKAYKDRDREAEGIVPENHLWMYIKAFKPMILTELVRNVLKMSVIKEHVFTPFTTPDFYYNMAHLVDGIYLFGDNAMFIKKGQIKVIYDMSTSDIYQGFLRRDAIGNNFSWFIRVDPDIDCGPTGDAWTTGWNIEGLICIIDAFYRGLLDTKGEDWPFIPGLQERSDTFLGWHYDDETKIWHTLGIRGSVDDAHRRIPFNLPKDNVLKKTFFTKEFGPQKAVNIVEFASSLIPTGVIDFDFIKFQNWIKRCRNEAVLLPDDDTFGAGSLISKELRADIKTKEDLEKRVNDFMSNFNLEELERLAQPLELTDQNFKEYISKQWEVIESEK